MNPLNDKHNPIHTFRVAGGRFHTNNIECVTVGGRPARDVIASGLGHFVLSDGSQSVTLSDAEYQLAKEHFITLSGTPLKLTLPPTLKAPLS